MKRHKCVLRSHLQDDTRAFSHYVAQCFSVQTPGLLLLWAGSASSYDGFVLPRPLWGLLMQSVRKSLDIKYNRGERSRKSYRAGMNSFPFELVPFSFNLLLSASSWPESSLCFSSTPRGVLRLQHTDLIRVSQTHVLFCKFSIQSPLHCRRT